MQHFAWRWLVWLAASCRGKTGVDRPASGHTRAVEWSSRARPARRHARTNARGRRVDLRSIGDWNWLSEAVMPKDGRRAGVTAKQSVKQASGAGAQKRRDCSQG